MDMSRLRQLIEDDYRCEIEHARLRRVARREAATWLESQIEPADGRVGGKRLSLHPLTPEEALTAALNTPPMGAEPDSTPAKRSGTEAEPG